MSEASRDKGADPPVPAVARDSLFRRVFSTLSDIVMPPVCLVCRTPIQAHDALCAREQDYFYRAITEDIDLSRHMDDAVASLRICLAADESVRTGRPVRL